MDIKEISKQIHENARAKGFWDKERNTGEMLMLIVSEVAEAMEADRKNHFAQIFDKEEIEQSRMLFEVNVKNSFEDELADAMIRIMDLAHSRNIDLEWHILQKMKYNEGRPHMHGKKY